MVTNPMTVRMLTLLLGFALFTVTTLPAQSAADEDTTWKQYFAWLQEGDPAYKTPQHYRAKLAAGGVSAADADERMRLIEKLTAQHSDDLTALNFNRTYTSPTPYFNTRPNSFLVAVARDLRPGTALDVAMGQGRNAIFLASSGWVVTGFDIAEQGLAVAQAEAERRGLKITTIKSRHQDFDFGSEKWDLVVFSYAWVPLADPAFVDRVRMSLKPGGVVVIEAPAEDPLKPVALREWPPEPTDEVNTLVKAWAPGFRILRYEDAEDICDWRNRKARVLRLLARKW